MADIEVDIWIWPLTVGADVVGELAALLTPDERARAARFVAAGDRDSYIVGRGRLRQILGSCAGVPGDELRFAYGPAGKPSLDGHPSLHFNLSHSGTWAAAAVSAAFPVGIDIETIRPIREQLAERYFSAGEVQALADLPNDEQTAAFFRCWTRKEAVVKAIGDGLNIPLNSFTVSVKDERCPAMLHAEGAMSADAACWKFRDFTPAPDVAGAVAVKGTRSDQRFAVNFRETQ